MTSRNGRHKSLEGLGSRHDFALVHIIIKGEVGTIPLVFFLY